METTAQVSLYPLRQSSIGVAIREAIGIFRAHGLEPKIGVTSTVIQGEAPTVFSALQEAYGRAAERGDAVMIVTLTNAAPEPDRLVGW